MKSRSLSPTEFSLFSALVEERAGLAYSLADKSIFESKLWARANEAGFDSALDYYYLLRYDDPNGSELQALVQALVVHETFFFRELDALRAGVEHFVKPRVEAGERARVWCAACSTGEEPLTLAMLLASLNLLPKVDIVASDISASALARARAGKYGGRALRLKAPPWAAPFLRTTEAGVEVAQTLISAIDFRQVNLVDPDAAESIGVCDLILCRNVLIYFRDDTAQRVVNRLEQRIRPGGALLVGVSESLMRHHTGLSCEERGGTFVYRRVST